MDVKQEILEVLDDDLRELKEEISEKKEEIIKQEADIEHNEEFEMDDDEVDDYIDGCYDEVEVMGGKYPMSEVLKAVDEGKYEDIRDEETNRVIEENREELEDELDELNEELEELKENYEEEFNDLNIKEDEQ